MTEHYDIEDVVLYLTEHYLRGCRPSGMHNIKALCPFHDDNNPSFSISKRTGKWYCFTENEGGNLKELMERLGVDKEFINAAPTHVDGQHTQMEELEELPKQLLGVFDWMPTDLVQAGFKPEVLRSHHIGFDRRYTHEKITFPIIDRDGVLRGISGRDTRGMEPRYKFYTWSKDPNKNDFMGVANVRNYVFKRDKWLWREDKIKPSSDVVLAEGFKGALWLAQHGHDSVASMGVKVSYEQIYKLQMLRPRRIYIFLDGDQPGLEATIKVASFFLAQAIFNAFVCAYPEGKDEPDALNQKEIDQAFETAEPVTIYLAEKGAHHE